MRRGQPELAEIKFREAISGLVDGNWEIPHIRFELARSLHLQHRHEEGDREIFDNFQVDSSRDVRVDVRWLRAECNFARQEYVEAGDLYWSAIELAMEIDTWYFTYDYEIEVFTNMVSCFYLIGAPEKAEQTLRHLRFDEVSAAEILLEIAERHTASNYEYTGLPGQMSVDSCARCIQHSIELKPQAKAYAMLGRHFQMGGQQAEAVEVYSKMNSLFPADFDEDSARSFGWALQAVGSLEEAEHWLRRSATDFYPDDLYEVEPLITFYGQYRRWGEAREVIENYLSAQMFKSKNALKDSVWAWSLHARCCELLGDLETAATSRFQANLHLEQKIRDNQSQEPEALNLYGLARCLKTQGRVIEAEALFLNAEEMFIQATQKNSLQSRWWGHHWLGVLHEEREDLEKSEANFREAFRIESDGPRSDALDIGRILLKRGLIEESETYLRAAFDQWPQLPQKYWLGKYLLESGQLAEAEKLLAEVAHDEPFDAEYSAALEECRRGLTTQEVQTSFIDFATFVDAGRFWLESARWETSHMGLLAQLFSDGTQWADPSYVLFTDYDVSEDDLDDTLARAVAIAREIQFVPEMPVMLITENIEVRLDLEGRFLRAWVGERGVGVAVTIDVSNWDLHYASSDRDAMFAAGVAINWFLDCSIAIARHPKFKRLNSRDVRGFARAGEIANGWTTESQFDADIEQIVSGQIQAPPKAHRVRGHIRKLGDGLPSDEARDNAPPYIRRHMATNETWVRGHSRGGDVMGQHLLTRLQTFSSLADFLATAQREP